LWALFRGGRHRLQDKSNYKKEYGEPSGRDIAQPVFVQHGTLLIGFLVPFQVALSACPYTAHGVVWFSQVDDIIRVAVYDVNRTRGDVLRALIIIETSS
jgi:hypothetical protein